MIASREPCEIMVAEIGGGKLRFYIFFIYFCLGTFLESIVIDFGVP